MFLQRANRSHPEFRIGAFEMWPQAPGMAAWGLMTGVAMLFASVIAGLVWDRFGANATFLVGAGFAAVALLIAAQLKAVAEIF